MVQLLNPVQEARITILVDNYIDVFLSGEGSISRLGLRAKEPLWAEHGLSILVETGKSPKNKLVLVDTAYSAEALLHNMRILGYDPLEVASVFVSHGHPDHYGGLLGFLENRKSPVNIILHPDSLLPRYSVSPNGDVNGPYFLDKEQIGKAGGILLPSRNEMFVSEGILVTGEISRTHPVEWPGKGTRRILKDGLWQDDGLLDDQAVILNLDGKGLVVIGSCMHSGIVNTLEYAKTLTGIDRIYAVIGGFHLTGAPEENIRAAVENIKRINPTLVLGGHCTGVEATCQMMRLMPKQFHISCPGTVVNLKA